MAQPRSSWKTSPAAAATRYATRRTSTWAARSSRCVPSSAATSAALISGVTAAFLWSGSADATVDMSNAARQICLVASVKLVSWSWRGGPIGAVMHSPAAESARDRQRDRGECGVPFPGRSSGAGSGRCYSRSAMAATTTNDLKRGMTLDLSEGLFQVVDFQRVKPGKGPAFVRTTLRNVRTGGVLDKTFRADERVVQAMVDKKDMQFLYRDGADTVSMDNRPYEQINAGPPPPDAA